MIFLCCKKKLGCDIVEWTIHKSDYLLWQEAKICDQIIDLWIEANIRNEGECIVIIFAFVAKHIQHHWSYENACLSWEGSYFQEVHIFWTKKVGLLYFAQQLTIHMKEHICAHYKEDTNLFNIWNMKTLS